MPAKTKFRRGRNDKLVDVALVRLTPRPQIRRPSRDAHLRGPFRITVAFVNLLERHTEIHAFLKADYVKRDCRRPGADAARWSDTLAVELTYNEVLLADRFRLRLDQ